MTKFAVVGIDPGQTGAIASLSLDGKHITITDFKIEPETKRINSYHFSAVIDAMLDYHEADRLIIYLEKSQAMTKQGVVSMFNYGVNYGILYGLLTARIPEIEVVEINPRKWKKEFDLNSDKKAGIIKGKQDSVNTAIMLYPQREDMFRRPKKNGVEGYVLEHGRADAILICEYGRRLNCGLVTG